MRYLRKFLIFESYDPEDILEYFQDMIDNDLEVIYEEDFNGKGDNCIEIAVPKNWDDKIPDEDIIKWVSEISDLHNQYEKIRMFKFFFWIVVYYILYESYKSLLCFLGIS